MTLSEYADIIRERIINSIKDPKMIKEIINAAESHLIKNDIPVSERKWFWEYIAQQLNGQRPAIKAQSSDALSQAVEFVLAQLASISNGN